MAGVSIWAGSFSDSSLGRIRLPLIWPPTTLPSEMPFRWPFTITLSVMTKLRASTPLPPPLMSPKMVWVGRAVSGCRKTLSVMVRLRTPIWELTPQYWIMSAWSPCPLAGTQGVKSWKKLFWIFRSRTSLRLMPSRTSWMSTLSTSVLSASVMVSAMRRSWKSMFRTTVPVLLLTIRPQV